MPDKKNRGISNRPIAIQDVPDAPTVSASNVGTSRPYNNGAATVTVTKTTGGNPSSYSVTSSPGSFTASGTSPLTVTGLSSATAYTFTATATNASGITSPTSSASGSITATTVPQAPTIGTFTDGADGSTGTLSFTAGATGGSTITGYKYSTDGVNYVSASGTTSPLSLTGLTPGAITLYLKATNANGDSAASGSTSGIVTNPATWLIQRVDGTGSSGTITFSSIPSTYKHLQIRYIGKSTTSAGGANAYNINITFNSDSGSNYAAHRLSGSGAAASAGGSATQTSIILTPTTIPNSDSTLASMFGTGIIDILDYTSTSKNKTMRTFIGGDFNNATTGFLGLTSGLWYATPAAITSITLTLATGSWTTTSSFALYGIKG